MDNKRREIEGHSITRPPDFNESNYIHWKTKMRIFLFSNDFEFRQNILWGHQDLIIKKDLGNGKEKRAHTINEKSMIALYCALNEIKFNGVSLCTTPKKIWDLLEVAHKVVNQVKDSKISLHSHKYETLRMEDNKIINAMYNRFNNIILCLKGLGKTTGRVELNHKLLLSLRKEWQPKVMAI